MLAGVVFAAVAGPRLVVWSAPGRAAFAPERADTAGPGREGLPPPLTRIDDSIFRPLRPPAADPFGYPASTVDRTRVAALLLRGDYDALERMMGRLHREVLLDVRRELDLVDAFDALDRHNPETERRLDEWIARHPGSAHARVARARHRTGGAWRARGGDVISRTAPDRIAAMGELARRAAADARAGLEIEPAHLAGHAVLLDLARLAGSRRERRDILDAALEEHPASFVLREAHMAALEPRWGGSLAEMRRFGRQSAALKARNPRLAALEGSVHAYRGEQHRRAKRYAAAVGEYDRAIAYGPEGRFLRGRGRAWLLAEDPVRAHADLEAALQQRPQGPEGLELHGRALYGILRNLPPAIRGTALVRAEADFRLLAAIEPDSRAAARWLGHVEEMKAWCRRLPEPCR